MFKMREIRKLYAVFAAVFLVLSGAVAEEQGYQPPLPSFDRLVEAFCERVVDGDTAWFQVTEDGIQVTHTVRFLNIDTPETVHPDMEPQPYGKEASNYVTEALEGQEVWLEYDIQRTDKYGRQLCHVWMKNEVLFNLQLVRLGYARVLVIQPNIRYHKFFLAAEEYALGEEAGIWAIQQ